MADMIHPAVEVVREALRLMWDREPDREVTGARARLVVQRLIEYGHIVGKVHKGDTPLAPDDAPQRKGPTR